MTISAYFINTPCVDSVAQYTWYLVIGIKFVRDIEAKLRPDIKFEVATLLLKIIDAKVAGSEEEYVFFIF